MPLGHYEISFQILEVPSAGTDRELLNRMRTASEVSHTGWPPFVQLRRREFEPRIVDGNVETWMGQPAEDRLMRNVAHCDFWQAHRSGLFFLLRGYAEDTSNEVASGSIVDIGLPVWRVGEACCFMHRVLHGNTLTTLRSPSIVVILDYGIVN